MPLYPTNRSTLSDAEKYAAKLKFVAALEETGTIRAGCQAAGITRSMAKVWREEDAGFAQSWDDARANMLDSIEETLIKNARTRGGTDAYMFLNGNRPEVYRPKEAVKPTTFTVNLVVIDRDRQLEQRLVQYDVNRPDSEIASSPGQDLLSSG